MQTPAGRAFCAVIIAATVCACRPGPRGSSSPIIAPAASADSAIAEQGYVAPPQVLKAALDQSGTVTLRGSAGPGATIQLQSPEGESHTSRARRTGDWVLRLHAVQRPHMFALSETVDGRAVHAEGALIVLPRPAPAALLARAGFGSLIIGDAGAQPSLATIDYDPGGFAAFSGTARPGATVRLSLDGGPAGVAQADAMGRYTVLAASHRLSFGTHLAAIETGTGQLRRPFVLTQPGPLTSPYQVAPDGVGWRVEWAAPGGGVQTTLVLPPQ